MAHTAFTEPAAGHIPPMVDTHLNVQVRAKDQYGTTVFHPVNRAAEIFASIARTRTLTPETLRHIQDLGIEVLIIRPIDTF